MLLSIPIVWAPLGEKVIVKVEAFIRDKELDASENNEVSVRNDSCSFCYALILVITYIFEFNNIFFEVIYLLHEEF